MVIFCVKVGFWLNILGKYIESGFLNLKLAPALLGADVTPQAPQASSFSMGMYVSSGAGSISSANHSRASSMAEDTPLGYVPMLPMSLQHRQESFVDLDHSKGIQG